MALQELGTWNMYNVQGLEKDPTYNKSNDLSWFGGCRYATYHHNFQESKSLSVCLSFTAKVSDLVLGLRQIYYQSMLVFYLFLSTYFVLFMLHVTSTLFSHRLYHLSLVRQYQQ